MGTGTLVRLTKRMLTSTDAIFDGLSGDSPQNNKDDKFFVDINGTLTLNRNNAEVQRAFNQNVKSLGSTQKD